METTLKDLFFNPKFYKTLSAEIKKVHSSFPENTFYKDSVDGIKNLSLNQRMRQTSVTLKKYLPTDYKKSLAIMFRVIPEINGSYANLVFPDFVSQYGHNHFEASMEALHFFTQYGSSEFAIREFLKRDFQKTLAVMKNWAGDKNHHVRRLASEGSRPRLPWSFKLDEVVKNPKHTLPILEKLKTDEELYVRKSVANHLNDFSKDHPALLIDTLKNWNLDNQHTAWIVKHACRTLIKKGDSKALSIFAFEKNTKVSIQKFKLESANIKIGKTLEFSFQVVSEKNKSQKLAIDFTIYYRKKLGELSPKVFKLKELTLGPGETISIRKTHRLQDFTTRKHYPGTHKLVITINGKSLAEKKFELLK
ncbi:MAG: DNA alkylation repair protein [Flavobacteriales bacterium]